MITYDCQLARSIYAEKVDAEMDDEDVQAQFPELRARVKVIFLATVYGISDASVAAKLDISVCAAKMLRRKFFERYPDLEVGMKRAVRQLQTRGYTMTASGLKRFRGASGRLSTWEKRWAVNSVVQGGGACILKLLLVNLGRSLSEHSAHVVVAIHDSVVIECPLTAVDAVSQVVRLEMIAAMQSLYPDTDPRIDINAIDLSCWNKNGRSSSIEEFFNDPDLRL